MGEWKNYFVYTRKERLAIISLILITLALLAIPHLFEPPLVPVKLTMTLPLVEITDDTIASAKEENTASHSNIKTAYYGKQAGLPKLFVFDPNTANEKELLDLGLSKKAAGVVIHYREKGGRFRQPEDLGKIYSIRKEQLNRLIPFVKIHLSRPEESLPGGKRSGWGEPAAKPRETDSGPVDINDADQAMFESLPGIGPTLALRIIRFREKLGGFAHIGQVKEVFGISDSVFQVIGPRLKCLPEKIRQIDLNQVNEPELAQHPYFRGRLGYSILRYREQHGPFQSKEELRKLGGVDEITWKKIAPYVFIKSG